jgi:hypothetical protein
MGISFSGKSRRPQFIQPGLSGELASIMRRASLKLAKKNEVRDFHHPAFTQHRNSNLKRRELRGPKTGMGYCRSLKYNTNPICGAPDHVTLTVGIGAIEHKIKFAGMPIGLATAMHAPPVDRLRTVQSITPP